MSEFEFDAFDTNESVDLTPLIDVIFLLLIFFIMTTTFLKPVMDVNLAGAKSSAAQEKQNEQLLITVTQDGQIFYEDKKQSLEDVKALLLVNPKKPINFYVDKGAPFGSFIEIVDIARLQKRDDFVITTRENNSALQ